MTRFSRLLHVVVVLLIAGGLAACGGSQSAVGPSSSASSGASSDDALTVLPGYEFPEADTVRVVTWNVEHFVDAYDDPYVDNRRENEPGEAMYGRVDLFVQAVRQLDADVLVLQEFESEAFAMSLVEERLSDSGYEFFASTESPTWYQNVVVMSRVPLGEVESYADVVTPIKGFTTDEGEPEAQSLTNHRVWLAEVHVRRGYDLHLVGAHLKAGPGARNAAWRIGQVRMLHEQFNDVLALDPDANLLVAGDLNSLSDSPELRLLLNTPERPAPDSLQTGTGDWKASFTGPLHGRTTYTHPTESPERQLDYLLVGEHLRPELVEGSAAVVRPLPDAQMQKMSDHLPVAATFRVEER